jgi:hypothetical protein
LKKIIKFLKKIQSLLKGKKVYLFVVIRLCYGLNDFAENYNFEILEDAAFQAGVLAAIRAAISKLKEKK